MAALTISLPDALGEWIQSRVATGGYASASDYVRELVTRDRNSQRDLDASILRGIAESDSGRVFDAEDVFDELEAKYSAMALVTGGR